MPKGLRIKWDHRTPSDERTADNLWMDCDLALELVFAVGLDRVLVILHLPRAAQAVFLFSHGKASGCLSRVPQMTRGCGTRQVLDITLFNSCLHCFRIYYTEYWLTILYWLWDYDTAVDNTRHVSLSPVRDGELLTLMCFSLSDGVNGGIWILLRGG